MDQPKMSMADLRHLIQIEAQRLKPAVEYVAKEPELKPDSRGNGTPPSVFAN